MSFPQVLTGVAHIGIRTKPPGSALRFFSLAI